MYFHPAFEININLTKADLFFETSCVNVAAFRLLQLEKQESTTGHEGETGFKAFVR